MTISPISGAVTSNKSAPNLIAAGTKKFLIKGIAVLSQACARGPKPLPRCLASYGKKSEN